MSEHLELIHTEENDPVYNMPYTPAIKVRSGATVYVAGVTAAPVYHHHPHIKSDFENIPLDPGEQTIRLIFIPISLLLGAFICGLGLLGFVLYFTKSWFTRNRLG